MDLHRHSGAAGRLPAAAAAAALIFLSMTMSTSCVQAPEGPWRLDRVATMADVGDDVAIGVVGQDPGKLLWTSGDGKVATVGLDGVVRAVGEGDAWIVARSPRTGLADSCLVSVGYEPQNPILPPTWGMYLADGEPHVFDGRMYLYGSHDWYDGLDDQGKREWCSDNYHVIWSDDLVHWNDAGEALNLADIPDWVKGDAARLWAPDVWRDPATGKYHMAACTNNSKIFVLDSDSPVGPFVNARTLTLDGKELGHIDPGVLVDDDGKVYIALPDFIIAQLDPDDCSRILPETVRDMIPAMPADNEPFEGPSLRKKDGVYYYIYIQNNGRKKDGWVPTRMAYLTATEPLGPYTYQGLIITNHDYPRAGNIHGSFEEFKGKWYVQYHRSVPSLSMTRAANLDPIEFNPDGTIRQARMTTSGIREAFRIGDRIQASGAVEFSAGRESGFMYKIRKGEYAHINFTAPLQWTGYRYVDFSEAPGSVTIAVKTGEPDRRLEVRRGSPDGPVIAVADLPDTGWKWKEVTVPVQTQVGGKDDVYLVAAKAPLFVKHFTFGK